MTTGEHMYRIAMAGEPEDAVGRLLNMAGLQQDLAKDICRRGHVDISMPTEKANKLKDLGFAVYRILKK